MSMNCPDCLAVMREETSHHRCEVCGFIRPCCEGEPLPDRPTRVQRVQGLRSSGAAGAHRDRRVRSRSETRRRAIREEES